MFWKLTDTAKAILWLWENDRKNWRRAQDRIVHQQTGVGVSNYLSVRAYYDIPDDLRSQAYTHDGQEVNLTWMDRRTIKKIMFKGQFISGHKELQRTVSDWGADRIANRVGRGSHRVHSQS